MRTLRSALARFARRSGFAALGAAVALGASLLAATPADASSAVLTRHGTLYEVYSARYGDLVPAAEGTPEARYPVLAFRTTPSGGPSTVEIVEGTLDSNDEAAEAIEFDETTGTAFVVYTQYTGLMSDVHFAVHRDGRWIERNIAPNIGLYLSLNPRLLVTRQRYLDLNDKGEKVTKSRSILSLVWWEESGVSQARYAAVFLEDGALDLDTFTAVNLNELAGASGPTPIVDLPFSAYQFPALQRDLTTNGGVFVSFANLSSLRQTVLRVTFPDDYTQPPAPGAPPNRRHIPIGGRASDGSLPKIDTTATVGTVISPNGVPTFFWQDVATNSLMFLHGDAGPDDKPRSISLRTDFSFERALSVLRDMVEKE